MSDAARVGLTERQLQILQAIADGESRKGIAGRLHCSPWTIKNQLTEIFYRLAAHSQAQAVAIAFRRGGIR